MDLAHLKNNVGAHHRTKRYGCGIGSGHGKTSGRGGKGQTARTGSSIRPGFEGGQMPLYRRMPKRGFNSFTQETYAVLPLDALNIFSDGDVVTPASLKAKGLLRALQSGVKILGDGQIKKKLTIVANAFSNAALKKIQAQSGECLIASYWQAEKDYRGITPVDVTKTKAAVPSVPKPRPIRVSRIKPAAAKPPEASASPVAATAPSEKKKA